MPAFIRGVHTRDPDDRLRCFRVISRFFLSKALKTMHVGTAYAIWMGIAVTGTTLTSVLVYKEPTSWIRVAFVGLIVFGIVGLQLTSPQKP